MKKNILLLVFIPMLAILYGTFGSCNPDNNVQKKDEDVFSEKLRSVPAYISEKGSFPEWLVRKIDEKETLYSKEIDIAKVWVYRGEWQKQTVYFINDYLSSCFCDIFYDNGEKVDLTNKDVANDFNITSKNWVLIYEFGNHTK